MSGYPRWLALSAAFVFACGGGGGEGGEEETAPDTAAAVQEAAPASQEAAAPEGEFTPVDLPDAFPSDFPIPPQSTVTNASSQSDPTGVISYVQIMTRSDPRQQFQWFKDALAQAGWTIASEGQSGQSRTLHAQQGESYVDIVVAPWGDNPESGWAQTDATIWKTSS